MRKKQVQHPPRPRLPFKARSVTRLMKVFEAAGKTAETFEIVTPDGTTYRVIGRPAAPKRRHARDDYR